MTKSWRDVLPVHPAADLFPMMTEPELRVLGEDIRKNGLKNPVSFWIDPHDRRKFVLDGRNRLDAMEMAGLDVVDGKYGYLHYEVVVSGDPYAYVISANIHRRHLTAELKDKLIADLIKAQPSKSNRQIAKATGRSHPHVAKVREELEKAGDVETVTTSIDTKGRKQPAKRIAQPKPKARNRASEGVPEVPATPEKRTSELPTRSEIPAGEIERLRARTEELESICHRVELENDGLRSEIEDLRTASAANFWKGKGIPDIVDSLLENLRRHQFETLAQDLARIIAEERHLGFYRTRKAKRAAP